MPSTTDAQIIEVFASIQGEGAFIGFPQVFIRFHGCSLSCRYCDTPETHQSLAPCKVYAPFSSNQLSEVPNPLSIDQLTVLLDEHYSSYHFFSLTGGEPLEQSEFIAAWLPSFKQAAPRKILLETAGVHAAGLARVLPWIDSVSMDIKLSSATGMTKSYWDHHDRFLQTLLSAAHPPQTYVKIVLNDEITDQEKERLESFMRHYPSLDYFFQPTTPLASTTVNLAIELTRYFHSLGFRSRFLPQIHPLLRLK